MLWTKRFLGHVVGALLSVAVLFLLGQLLTMMGAFFDWVLEPTNVTKYIAVVVAILFLSTSFAKFFMTYPHPISIGATNIPNFFYDKQFEKRQRVWDEKLLDENEAQAEQIIELENLVTDMSELLTQGQNEIENMEYITEIFVRHHKNSSRLVRSLLQLWKEGKRDWLLEFCNNVLSECVTTLTKDRADKSSTLYFIEGDELAMFAYNRIEFSSTRDRRFRMGEGFAGYIWQTEQQAIENVEDSEHFQGDYEPRHTYGSILGVPIKIGTQVIGVLCIQSELSSGFKAEDLNMVQFYADITGLAFLIARQHDILTVNG